MGLLCFRFGWHVVEQGFCAKPLCTSMDGLEKQLLERLVPAKAVSGHVRDKTSKFFTRSDTTLTFVFVGTVHSPPFVKGL